MDGWVTIRVLSQQPCLFGYFQADLLNHRMSSTYLPFPVLANKEKVAGLENKMSGRRQTTNMVPSVSLQSHQSRLSPVVPPPDCRWPPKKCMNN